MSTPTKTLKPYQRAALAQVRHAFVNGVAPKLPVGAGKTVIAAYVRRPAVKL